MTTVTKRVPSGASGGSTLRVVGAITSSITVRVPEEVIGLGPFLLLEGDFSGALAFPVVDEEADFDGYLKLQGTY
jgi:hypothetical protein